MRIMIGPAVYKVDELDLDLVASGSVVLRARGLYETALLSAYAHTNHAHWSQVAIVDLFRRADPARLRAAGDALKGTGPRTIFQGCATHHEGAGLSWTLDLEQARWFADRHPDPTVWSGVVDAADILAYLNAKEEQEVLVLPERVSERHRT